MDGIGIDPDDPRTPRRQLTDLLRAAILTGKLTPGSQIPSGPELAKRYNVAKVTAQQAVQELRNEGLVVARRGSGTYVRERPEKPLGLRPHLERAFTKPQVTIDFAGFSGETLHNAITEPLDQIRDGRFRPDSIAVRILIPDPATPWTMPANAADLSDNPLFRQRASRIMQRHTFGIVDEVHELQELGLIQSSTAEVRAYPAAPMFKVYIVNGDDAFFGFYSIEEHQLTLAGEPATVWDLMGKNTLIFHMDTDHNDVESMKSQFVQQAQTWFDSLWKISKPINP
ncbi:GntR family transcriptional regulator [Nocardia tenerifensis]|uniref:GntR family transcriptional regulator n=1 Tax=Nocardia tenerifensis TaxID=228006 RepID=A0A318JQE5_9NOCA|nr:GntR family transcriptional regulator [Nocardia tenerifensis]PXX52295.1 GntR family transcriptional regulator [Nocardia tenerifensis]